MTLYCPVCLSNTLSIKSRGKAYVEVNAKRMDTHAFLYHLDKETDEQLLKNLKKKIEEYFLWFDSFQNAQTIKQIEISTQDIACENRCSFPSSIRISIINVIFTLAEVEKILSDLGKKYRMAIDLDKSAFAKK